MNKIVNGVANDYEFPFLEKTTENYYQVMNRYYTEEFVKQLQQELQRKDNIINELKNGIRELDNMFYETFRISQDDYFSISEWELKDFTDKIKELEKM